MTCEEELHCLVTRMASSIHCVMLQTITALKFALKAKIDYKKIHLHDRKSGSAFFLVNNNAFSLLIAFPTLPVQLFQVTKVSGLDYIAHLAMSCLESILTLRLGGRLIGPTKFAEVHTFEYH